MILYVLICKNPPFPGKYYKEKRQKLMLKLKIPFTDSAFAAVDESCIDLMRGMLQKDET